MLTLPLVQVVNYELGIVLRLERPEDVDAAVAWERPTRKYIEGDVPWVSTLFSSNRIPVSLYLFPFDSAFLCLGTLDIQDALSQIPQDSDFFK
jgi:hypothetical protein